MSASGSQDPRIFDAYRGVFVGENDGARVLGLLAGDRHREQGAHDDREGAHPPSQASLTEQGFTHPSIFAVGCTTAQGGVTVREVAAAVVLAHAGETAAF